MGVTGSIDDLGGEAEPAGVPFWRRRRFEWPVAGVLVLILAAVIAFHRSGESRVVLINETGGRIERVKIVACGISAEYASIDDRESVFMPVTGDGQPGEVTVTVDDRQPPIFKGGVVEPAAGCRLFVHLRLQGLSDAVTYYTWRRRWFGDVSE
jgi:hypothetical protein